MKGRTYRYLRQEPLYPFGYGLSYTTFKYNKIKLSKNNMKVGETVDLQINIQNAGKMAGDEVVQVYIKNKQDKDGPIKSLRSFKRVNIPAGSSSDFCINLPSKAFESYYEDKQRMDVRPGEYVIYVGSSSREKDLVKISFTIK